MQRIAKIALVVNAIVALLFAYSNFSLWSLVNTEYPYLIASHWSPLGISAPHYIINDSSISIVQTLYLYFNTPFWIFWVLLAVDLFFIVILAKKPSKQ